MLHGKISKHRAKSVSLRVCVVCEKCVNFERLRRLGPILGFLYIFFTSALRAVSEVRKRVIRDENCLSRRRLFIKVEVCM